MVKFGSYGTQSNLKLQEPKSCVQNIQFSSPGCGIFGLENTPSMKCDSVSASNDSDGGKSIPLSNTCFSTYTDFILDCSKKIDPEFVFNKLEIDENDTF